MSVEGDLRMLSALQHRCFFGVGPPRGAWIETIGACPEWRSFVSTPRINATYTTDSQQRCLSQTQRTIIDFQRAVLI